jgi:hypothetical protein
VELQQYAEQFRKEGLGVAVITYDSVEILANFGKRQNISIPTLADPKSEIIRAFGILNTHVPADHMAYGVPFPGTFIVDQNGVVKSKYFEDSYRDRVSAPTILLREFGSAAGTRETAVRTNHLEMKYHSTRDIVRPNLRFTLVADFQLQPKMHVYAPSVQGYIPIRFEIEPSPYFTVHPTEYPPAEDLYLAAIKETVPVFQGSYQVRQDITMLGNDVLDPVLKGNKEIKVRGRLRYQACDDKICYLPQTIPLEWTLQLDPLDRQRVPEAIQHRAPAAGGK